MRTIHTEIGIGAPAAAVWAILTDTAKWPQWNPFMLLRSGKFAVGERLVVEIKPPGRSAMTFKPIVTQYEPEREIRWLGHVGMRGIFDGEHGFRIVPEDAGRCRFVQFENFRGILAGPILWTARKPTLAGFEAMNRALKARAETR